MTMEEQKQAAVRFEAATRILTVLVSPMAMLSRLDRNEALELAKEHSITAAELLEIYFKILKKT
jgi:hypothetical protein